LQSLRVLGPLRIIGNGLIDPLVEPCNATLEELDQALDVPTDDHRCGVQAALLGHDQGDELASPSDEIGHLTLPGAWQGPPRRTSPLPEQRQHAGIERVCFRENTEAFAEASKPPRVHDDDREAGRGERLSQRPLVAPRRLDDDRRELTRQRLLPIDLW
jgi:hypothetical protein